MRSIFVVYLLFISVLSYSQADSTSRKNGISFFAGLGTGGNVIKQGFARGFSARYHFKAHTIDGYIAHTTRSEVGYSYGHDSKLTYDAFNYGLSYGVGLYDRTYSYAVLTRPIFLLLKLIFEPAPCSGFRLV